MSELIGWYVYGVVIAIILLYSVRLFNYAEKIERNNLRTWCVYLVLMLISMMGIVSLPVTLNMISDKLLVIWATL